MVEGRSVLVDGTCMAVVALTGKMAATVVRSAVATMVRSSLVVKCSVVGFPLVDFRQW